MVLLRLYSLTLMEPSRYLASDKMDFTGPQTNCIQGHYTLNCFNVCKLILF